MTFVFTPSAPMGQQAALFFFFPRPGIRNDCMSGKTTARRCKQWGQGPRGCCRVHCSGLQIRSSPPTVEFTAEAPFHYDAESRVLFLPGKLCMRRFIRVGSLLPSEYDSSIDGNSHTNKHAILIIIIRAVLNYHCDGP